MRPMGDSWPFALAWVLALAWALALAGALAFMGHPEANPLQVRGHGPPGVSMGPSGPWGPFATHSKPNWDADWASRPLLW